MSASARGDSVGSEEAEHEEERGDELGICEESMMTARLTSSRFDEFDRECKEILDGGWGGKERGADEIGDVSSDWKDRDGIQGGKPLVE